MDDNNNIDLKKWCWDCDTDGYKEPDTTELLHVSKIIKTSFSLSIVLEETERKRPHI